MKPLPEVAPGILVIQVQIQALWIKSAKSLPWAKNLNKSFTVLGRKFKFSA